MNLLSIAFNMSYGSFSILCVCFFPKKCHFPRNSWLTMEKKNFVIRYLIIDTYVASYMTTAAPRFNSSRHVVATILLKLKVRYRRYSEIVISCFILKVSEI